MFEYETISPVIPGNHIDGWKKIRRSQWAQVKSVLQDISPTVKGKALTNLKNNYYLSDDAIAPPMFDENGRSAMMEPDFWVETMLISLFLHPDQSQQRWEQRFAEIMAPRLSERRPVKARSLTDRFADRSKFLEVAHYLNKNSDPDFGALGGLEQRLLPYYVQSPVYTDETFIANNTEYRRIPWRSPTAVHNAIIARNGHGIQKKLPVLLLLINGCMSCLFQLFNTILIMMNRAINFVWNIICRRCVIMPMICFIEIT